MKPSGRLLALGGVVGPTAFVWSWARGGAATEGYSPVRDHISELAAVDAPTRAAMTTGFVVYGIGVTALGFALRERVAGPAWIAAVVTGISSFGVAAAPLRARPTDRAHATFAAIGYAGIAALPLLASRPLATAGRSGWSRASVYAGAASATCLIASTVGPGHGFWQRLGLTVGDVWIVAAAASLLGAGS